MFSPVRISTSVCACLTAAWLVQGAEAPPDYRFRAEVLAAGLVRPMELELAPDGRIFFNEFDGALRIWRPDTRAVVEAGRLEVFTEQENGFLGFALDPGFATNGWIYLFHSPKDYAGQRLSRFVMRGDALDPASEKRLLEFPEQRKDCCHHAGSVEFGPDGNLFISTGDNTHPAGDSDGYAPIDERPGREPYDAQKSSANTHDLRGKILRIRPTAEGGYTIPEGNLFPPDGSGGRPEIYVMGCRNPWRMSVDERTGIVYWGEVGPDAGGDGPRGPRGYDELNQARVAGNFGWPYFIANNQAYADYDFAARQVGSRYDPRAPTNASPSNTGARVLPPAQPALIYWPYGESREFPMLGQGGRTACAGPVFHFRPGFRETGGFPEFFDRCLLFYDWQRPFLKWARLDGDSRLVGIESFPAAVTLANDRDRIRAAEAAGGFVIRRPVDAVFGPDGCLYLLDYGETWGVNADARMIRISYRWGNLPPVARVEADVTSGREPLRVALSSAGSMDHEGSPLRYEWRLHPGDRLVSREAAPELVVEVAGNHVVELRVTDDQGAAGIATLPLVVGNSAPRVRFLSPSEGDFFTPGEAVSYSVLVEDAEEGSSADYEENFESRVFVKAKWGRAEGRETPDDPGLAAMKQSDCFNCHAVEQKLVGPALLEVANRYRGQTDALETSVQRVLAGSSGVWSEVPMLPHAGLNPDQVRMMVRWVYALEPGKTGEAAVRGLTGALTAPAEAGLRVGLLEAAFADRGRGPAGSLEGRSVVRLRSRRLEAEAAEEKAGLKVLGGFLGAIDHGHYARWNGLNLGDSRRVIFRVASGGAGGRIELRTGSVAGPVVATVEVGPTGGWERWVEVETPLVPVEGRVDVFVVFVNPGRGGLMNLDWVEFARGAR